MLFSAYCVVIEDDLFQSTFSAISRGVPGFIFDGINVQVKCLQFVRLVSFFGKGLQKTEVPSHSPRSKILYDMKEPTHCLQGTSTKSSRFCGLGFLSRKV